MHAAVHHRLVTNFLKIGEVALIAKLAIFKTQAEVLVGFSCARVFGKWH